ncbi:MAG: hypothetical protein QW505_03365 [Thermoplasmata archaeon]
MTSRISFWSEEQKKIQAKYDFQLSKEAIESLLERIRSLESLGRMTKKESAQLQKSIKDILKKIQKATE